VEKGAEPKSSEARQQFWSAAQSREGRASEAGKVENVRGGGCWMTIKAEGHICLACKVSLEKVCTAAVN
jgi:hypothetical protein